MNKEYTLTFNDSIASKETKDFFNKFVDDLISIGGITNVTYNVKVNTNYEENY